MGSEVEDAIDEFSDVENTVFVAVGKNVKESKSLILWSLEFFKDMNNMKICLLHIHQPPPLITLCKFVCLYLIWIDNYAPHVCMII